MSTWLQRFELAAVLALLTACGTPPRTYGDVNTNAPLAPADKIAVGFAPGYPTAATTHDGAARNALGDCVFAPLRARFPTVDLLTPDVLQKDLDASEPAILRSLHWQQRLRDPAFLGAIGGLGVRYAIELQDQSSGFDRVGPTSRRGIGSGVAIAGRTELIRVQATIIDLANHRVVATLNGAAEGESKFGLGISGGIPVPIFIPPRGQNAGYVCSDLGAALANLFVLSPR